MKGLKDAKRILYRDRTYKVVRVCGDGFTVLCQETQLVTHQPFWWVEKVHGEGLAEIEF